jgi:RHS repeat-associated protein
MFDPSGGWLGIYGVLDVFSLGAKTYAWYNGSETYFNHVNNLNSTAMLSNHAGSAVEDVLFYPWGQTWPSHVWGSGGYQFAGMPYYDTSTNTNYTRYRVYSQNLGRWLSPDPIAGDITNPQSLNLYAYVMNNPTTFTDPLGLAYCDPNSAIYDENGFLAGYDEAGCISDEEQKQWNDPGYSVYVGGAGPTVSGSTQPVDYYEDPGPGFGSFGGPLTQLPLGGGWGGGAGAGGGRGRIITWPQLQQLVHHNNESNLCDELIDCIVFKESPTAGGFNAEALGRPFNPPEGGGTQQAKGLMQITQNTAATINNVYRMATSGAALYQGLFDPAINIKAGSNYIQYLYNRYGTEAAALSHYGPRGYADDIRKCVDQLQQGNLGPAEAAARGND